MKCRALICTSCADMVGHDKSDRKNRGFRPDRKNLNTFAFLWPIRPSLSSLLCCIGLWSQGQATWPKYWAAKSGKVRFFNSILPNKRKYFIFIMANSELPSHFSIYLCRDFAIFDFSFHKNIRFKKALQQCTGVWQFSPFSHLWFSFIWDFQTGTGLIRQTLLIALILDDHNPY